MIGVAEIRTDDDHDFRSRALALVATNVERLAAILLTFRSEITHEEPARAVLFGMLTLATIIEVNALENVSMWREIQSFSAQSIEQEAARTLLSYLRAGPTDRLPPSASHTQVPSGRNGR